MNKKISTSFAIILIILLGSFLAFILVQGINQNQMEVNPDFAAGKNEKNDKIQIANPASVYCKKQRGKLEIRTNGDGSQTGYCKFENGRECEEWAYFRGECGKLDISNWNTYKNIKYGYELKLPLNWVVNDRTINDVFFSVSSEKDSLALEVKVTPVSGAYNIDNLLKESLPEEVKSGRNIQKEEIVVDGETGYSVMDCGKFECVTQKWAVVRNGKFYFINSKNGLMPEFEQIFATFKFIK